MNTANTVPQWTQDEAVAFECARECITDMMGICSTAIADEEAKQSPDAVRLASLENELTKLARERAGLSVKDGEHVAQIRSTYGAQIRTHRERHRQQAA